MIDLVNFVNVSVSQTPTGLGAHNMNNLALFTSESSLDPYFDTWRAYVSPSAVGEDFGTDSETYAQAVAVFSQQPNILRGGGNLIVIPLSSPSESLADAVERTKGNVFYCGIISTDYPSSGDMKTVADAIQAHGDKILILPSDDDSLIAGAFTTIKNAEDYAARCLLYQTSAEDARLFAAAYAGRAFSTNFRASNGCQTMQFKTLVGVDPDEAVTQTIFTNAETAGVDLYVSTSGMPMVVSNGANKFFDQVYNLMWFVDAIKVAVFNTLYQVSGKIPQTEAGVSVLKGAIRGICEQAVVNSFLAPGTWTSPETFGDQELMLQNIEQRGYYIYSQPVSQQSSADRESRIAPLIQVAVKESGAIHSTEIIINVNP